MEIANTFGSILRLSESLREFPNAESIYLEYNGDVLEAPLQQLSAMQAVESSVRLRLGVKPLWLRVTLFFAATPSQLGPLFKELTRVEEV